MPTGVDRDVVPRPQRARGPGIAMSVTSTAMAGSIIAASLRNCVRATATSLLATSPLTRADRCAASINCSVVSRVLPSIVTVRPPNSSRLTAVGELRQRAQADGDWRR